MNISIEDRVSAGIDWLNEHGPAEWWDRIDQPINILDGSVCVLGQVFAAKADETGMVDGYSYVINEYTEIWNAPASFGFCDNGVLTDTLQLEAEWAKAINKIRTEVTA